MKKSFFSEERSYRRGFSHGYQVGIETKSENMDELQKKIEKWRNDNENLKGAPGTSFENVDMYCSENNDDINHPNHYQGNDLEAIDVIEAFDLGFNMGNVVKYVLRAGRKDCRLQDLKKAHWYLTREICNLEKENA